MKIEVIGIIGQAMDIENQMAGMCMIGSMTEGTQAAAKMLMSVTDTDFIRPSFSVRCLMLVLLCGCCIRVSVYAHYNDHSRALEHTSLL